MSGVERCRFCGADGKARGGACGSCGETEAGSAAARWYHSNATVILGLALLGPFALPLVWTHPRYKLATKLALSVMVVAFAVWATLFTRDLLRKLTDLLFAAT